MDKLRLFLIYFLCTPAVSDAEYDQYAGALQAGGCDLSALTYLRRWRSFTMIGNKNLELNQVAGQQGTTKAVSMFRLVGWGVIWCLIETIFQLLDITVQQLCHGGGQEPGGQEAQPPHHQDSGRHHGAEAMQVQ